MESNVASTGTGEAVGRVVFLTRHARRRGARRNVAPDAVDYVLTHGRRIQRTGVTFYFLGRRDMPEDDRRASWASRLEGTVVLLAGDGEVVTVYRNRRALRAITRKMKYMLPMIIQDYAQGMGEIDSWTGLASGVAPQCQAVRRLVGAVVPERDSVFAGGSERLCSMVSTHPSSGASVSSIVSRPLR
jgi:hypothetical protein